MANIPAPPTTNNDGPSAKTQSTNTNTDTKRPIPDERKKIVQEADKVLEAGRTGPVEIVSTDITGIHNSFPKSADMIDRIIGLPPDYYKNPTLLQVLKVSAMPVVALYPALPKYGQSDAKKTGLQLFSLDYKKGLKQYNEIISNANEALAEVLPTINGIGKLDSCLYVAFLNDTSFAESFNIEFGQSKFEELGNSFSSTLQEVRYITGASDIGASTKALGESFGAQGGIIGGGLETFFKGAGAALGAGADVLNKLLPGLGQILSGSKVDFPMIWRGASYNPSYSLTVRLYNWGVLNEEAFIKNIVGPIVKLLAFTMPVSDSESTYTFPVLCTAISPGLFKIKSGYISSIEVIKGGENLDISWWQRVGSVDLKITINDLYKTMIADTRAARDKEGGIETAIKSVLDMHRPLLSDYVKNLVSKTAIDRNFYTYKDIIDDLAIESNELGVKHTTKQLNSRTITPSQEPKSRVNSFDQATGNLFSKANQGDKTITGLETDSQSINEIGSQYGDWGDQLYSYEVNPDTSLEVISSDLTQIDDTYSSWGNMFVDYEYYYPGFDTATSNINTGMTDLNDNFNSYSPDYIESALSDSDSVYLAMNNSMPQYDDMYSSVPTQQTAFNWKYTDYSSAVNGYDDIYSSMSGPKYEEIIGRCDTVDGNIARYVTEEQTVGRKLPGDTIDSRIVMLDKIKDSTQYAQSAVDTAKNEITSQVQPLVDINNTVLSSVSSLNTYTSQASSISGSLLSMSGSLVESGNSLGGIRSQALNIGPSGSGIVSQIDQMTSSGGYAQWSNKVLGKINTTNQILTTMGAGIGLLTALGTAASNAVTNSGTANTSSTTAMQRLGNIFSNANNLKTDYEMDRTYEAYQYEYDTSYVPSEIFEVNTQYDYDQTYEPPPGDYDEDYTIEPYPKDRVFI
jgi:hypothetical protein